MLRTKHYSKARSLRGNRGQAIAEGAAVLVLLTMMTVGAVLLILGAGTLIYYKIKLAGVADGAARIAVEGKYWLGAPRPAAQYDPTVVTGNVKTLVKAEMEALGLPTSDTVQVDLSRDDYASVTISVKKLPIISGGILPKFIALEETGVQPYSKDNPVAVFGLGYNSSPSANPAGGAGGVYLPCYGSGANDVGPSTIPTSLFPYWQYDLNPGSGIDTTKLYTGNGGPTQNWVAGPPFSHY